MLGIMIMATSDTREDSYPFGYFEFFIEERFLNLLILSMDSSILNSLDLKQIPVRENLA